VPTAIVGCLLLGGMTSCGMDSSASSHDDAIRTVRIYDLLLAYPRAVREVKDDRYVYNGRFSVNDEVRAGVFIHPAGSVVFGPVRLSRDSLLTFKIGIIDSAWDAAGDGVEFSVSVRRTNGATTKIFSRYLDPKHNQDDRRWIDERLSLRRFGDEDVHIVLMTAPGPANDYSYDWAVFAEPQVLLGPAS
jgi:hypothetical protein